MQFFEKLNTELPRDHANPLLGTCPKEMKTGVQTNTCTHMFREALCITAKKQKPPKGPATENQIEIYTCNGILCRNEVLTCATTWMNFKNNMLCERSQTQKITCCVILFIYEMHRVDNAIETE